MPYVCINSIQTLCISNRNVVSHHEMKCTGIESTKCASFVKVLHMGFTKSGVYRRFNR